jgi:hypothetical protein
MRLEEAGAAPDGAADVGWMPPGLLGDMVAEVLDDVRSGGAERLSGLTFGQRSARRSATDAGKRLVRQGV